MNDARSGASAGARAWWLVALFGLACASPAEETASGARAGLAPETTPGTAEAPAIDRAAARDEAARTAPWPDEAPPLTRALYAGSWTVDEARPFEHAWIDEPGLRETFTKRLAGRREWAGMSSQSDSVPLDLLLRDRTGPASAYVYALVHRQPTDDLAPWDPDGYPPAEAVLHVRHHGRLRLWFEGRLVVDAPAPPPGEVGHERVPVTLTGAFDVLLVKAGRGSPELGDAWAFEVRLGQPDGTPVPRQGWNTMRPSGYPSDLVGPPAAR